MAIHPATVHFPITFIALTGSLDLLYSATKFPPTASLILSTFKYLEVPSALVELLPQLSYYTTILALVTTVPSVVTGVGALLPYIQRDGFGSPKVRTGLQHAGLNDIAAAMLAYNWWTRRRVEDLAPTAVNTMLSGALALPVMLYAASLGGHLVYEYGMGVGKSSNKQKKSQ